MHLNQIMNRAVALVLALSLLMSLCACGASDIINKMASMVGVSMEAIPGQRLENSTWINSDLEGSIDENTELNLKDDFHTAVNRDWLLENDAQGDEILNSFTYVGDVLLENELRLLTPGAQIDPDPNIMSKKTLDHLQDLILDMMDLAGNQEVRNRLGAEPLRPYLEVIEQIDSMEKMTEYLKNTDGSNISGEDFVNFFVDRPINSRDFYTVHIQQPTHKLLQQFSEYTIISYDSYNMFLLQKAAVEHVLGQLSYTPKQIGKLLKDCYAFEERISHLVPYSSDLQSPSYGTRGDKIYTLEDIRDIQGKFPLTELLAAAGVAHSESFRIYEPGFLDFMGSYYNEQNLDKLKAYFMIHTVLDSLPYLDETCRNMHQDILDAKTNIDNSFNTPADEAETTDDPEALEKARLLQLYDDYIAPLLSVPFQLTYIGSYCSSTAKQNILNILEDIRTYYKELLGTTHWLSQATREKAIEKIEKMEFRVMYPDVLPDYSGLVYHNYEEGGNLLDAVAAINRVNNLCDVSKVNQPVNRSSWDLESMPTTVVNAVNDTSINSIVILCGIMAGGFMYDESAPIEENYARLGTILGHEITHSFDTNGYTLDAEGIPYGWWTNEDEVAFRLKSDKLVSYYTGLCIYPGSSATYDGQLIQTEAISDMGGMKCMLALAEEIPDFDYDLFFRAYASTWRTQTSISMEMELAADVHPLSFLRTNVTLQQFEKFFETYDIGPGDGMYLAPEDRIMVW